MNRKPICRYLVQGGSGALARCTAEATFPQAEMRLCNRHLAETARMIKGMDPLLRRALLGEAGE